MLQRLRARVVTMREELGANGSGDSRQFMAPAEAYGSVLHGAMATHVTYAAARTVCFRLSSLREQPNWCTIMYTFSSFLERTLPQRLCHTRRQLLIIGRSVVSECIVL